MTAPSYIPRRRVNIRPGVSVLSVLRHLNYKPWYALAEFVDNSLESFLTNRESLRRFHGPDVRLKVAIGLDAGDGRLTVRDNAAGIHEADYARAFRAAEVPPERGGLSEFGMGMKSASCWLAPRWHVRTSALGESEERTISFDIAAIVRDSLEELTVENRPARPEAHFTEIVLTELYKPPQTKTLTKIKAHLASIYRVFLRDGMLELEFDGDRLIYESPTILTAPRYDDRAADGVFWRKEIDFDFGLGLRVKGFAALRQKASTSEAGFALFRRRRLIQGSGDEGYRPEAIFGKSNSYRYQRLFGELELEGFDVSHTKDGFAWDEHEEVFLELLREALDAEPLPLLQQAENYRVRPTREEVQPGAETANARTSAAVERDAPPIITQLQQAPPAPEPPSTPVPVPLPAVSRRSLDLQLGNDRWLVIVELSEDPALGDWLELWDAPASGQGRDRGVRTVGVRLALAHPFMQRFGGVDAERIEPLLRVAVALGLAEAAARGSGVRMAGTIRRNVNELLRGALSNA